MTLTGHEVPFVIAVENVMPPKPSEQIVIGMSIAILALVIGVFGLDLIDDLAWRAGCAVESWRTGQPKLDPATRERIGRFGLMVARVWALTGIGIAIAAAIWTAVITIATPWRRCPAEARSEAGLGIRRIGLRRWRMPVLAAVLIGVFFGSQWLLETDAAICVVTALACIWLARNGRAFLVVIIYPTVIWGLFLLHVIGVIRSFPGDAGLGPAFCGILLGGIVTVLCIILSATWYVTTRRRYFLVALATNAGMVLFFFWWLRTN